MIAIIDYGLGNVNAFANIYKRLNIPATLASTQESITQASHIILPGVGSFDWAMQRLNSSGLRETLDKQVLENKIPVLGVCVGMQMMARISEEGDEAGLGWINAEVKRFDFVSESQQLILPHMGWNNIEIIQDDCLLSGFETESRFYFLHSYYFASDKKADVLATTYYGGKFDSSIQAGNCYGVQFHPEKSHGWGIKLLKNFAEV